MTVEKMAELAMYQMLVLMQADSAEPGMKLAAANAFLEFARVRAAEMAK